MLWQQMVNGISLGTSYALVALGYNLVFGVLGVLNMAHGSVAIAGAYVALMVANALQANLLVSVLVAMVAAGVIGALSERLVVRPVVAVNETAPFITTLGLAMIVEHALSEAFRPDPTAFPANMSLGIYRLGSVTITGTQVFIAGAAICLLLGLSYTVMRTQLGRFIRATAENRETAAFLGINTTAVSVTTFAMAAALAGAAGVLLAQYYGAMTPFLGTVIGIKGLIVVIVGGIGNFHGAMVTGLVLGMIEAYSTVILSSAYANLSGYVLLLIILVLKPTGLFGSAGLERD